MSPSVPLLVDVYWAWLENWLEGPTDRPAVSIRIMTLNAYIVVVRNSVALEACRRERWKYMSYLSFVDHQIQDQILVVGTSS
jgi:hypothetical protein